MEGPHQGDGACNLQRTQVALHGRPRDADGTGGFGGLELSAALAQNIFEQRVETVYVPEAEEPLDVTKVGYQGVVQVRRRIVRQQR